MGDMDAFADERNRILSFLGKAYEDRVSNVRQSIDVAHQALAMARAINDVALVGKCLNHVSLFYMIVGENQLSLEASKESIICFTELKDEMGIADAKFNIGSVFYKSDDHHAGLTNLVDALTIYRKYKEHGKESRVYKTLGTIYEYFGDAKNAFESYHRAVETARLAGDLNMESNAYNPLSGIYLDQHNVDMAIEFIARSIAIKTETGDVRGLAFALYGRGKIYTYTQQYEEAERDFKEAERIHLQMGEKLGLAMNYYKMGGLYTAMGKLKNALEVLIEGRAFCLTYNISQFKYKCDYQLYKVYKQMGEVEKSLFHLEEYLTAKDAVINIETFKIIENYEHIFQRQLTENKELLEAKELVENQNQQLVKANAELDQFVYRASHDLRAPISSIMGLVNIGMNAEQLDEAKHCFEMINKRVKAQDNFIRQIVENAKNARLALEWGEILMRPLLLEVVESLFFIEGAEYIDVHVAVGADFMVRSDASRLRSIVNNLISNAMQYRDPKKSHSFIQMDCQYTPQEWSLTVKDNGVGIVADRQDKIFNMFYRGNERSMGSGLGLFIVKETVATLGGRIEFESEFGVGSVFRVFFPVG
jgi:signal transduction histidine kinase